MAGALPTTGNDEDRLHVLGAAPQATNGIAPRADAFGDNMDSLSADASKRNILWDAEIRVAPHHSRVANGAQEEIGLIGQRMNNGEVTAVANFSGKLSTPILHVDLMVRSQREFHCEIADTGSRTKRSQVSEKKRRPMNLPWRRPLSSLVPPRPGACRPSPRFPIIVTSTLTLQTRWGASILQVTLQLLIARSRLPKT